jgi:acetyl-CoA carboxylase biotin carboxyl carrier protein
MDVELLRRMVHLMSANDLNTVDVRDGDKRVILKRGAVQPTISMAPFSPLQHTTPPYASYPAPSAQPTHVTAAAPATVAEEASLLAIKSPMVGTFYAAPSKGAKPFVTVGTVVDEETDVCIVEAMKVFNNIKAECRGTISKILVNDGQSVEFGQTMFLVKPS